MKCEILPKKDPVHKEGDRGNIQSAKNEGRRSALPTSSLSLEDEMEKIANHHRIAHPIHVGMVEESPKQLPIFSVNQTSVQNLEKPHIQKIPKGAKWGRQKTENEQGDKQVTQQEFAKVVPLFD